MTDRVVTTGGVAPPCRHRGGQMCPQCSWTRPLGALALLVKGRTVRTALPIPFLVASYGYLSGRRTTRAGPGWTDYLGTFHGERPGITEAVLGPATRPGGGGPYEWAAEPLRGARGLVLDLACGSAPTRPYVPDASWVGVDASAAELTRAASAGRTPLAKARGDALPLADASVDAVIAAMCLQVLTPLEDVLAEVRRVLRPGGMLVALVPSRPGPNHGIGGWARLLRALRTRTLPWPNPGAGDGLPTLLRRHGFVIETSDRRVYTREIADAADAALLVDSLYLPGIDIARETAAKHTLAAWSRPGRRLPFPLRRVVARPA